LKKYSKDLRPTRQDYQQLRQGRDSVYGANELEEEKRTTKLALFVANQRTLCCSACHCRVDFITFRHIDMFVVLITIKEKKAR